MDGTLVSFGGTATTPAGKRSMPQAGQKRERHPVGQQKTSKNRGTENSCPDFTDCWCQRADLLSRERRLFAIPEPSEDDPWLETGAPNQPP